MIDWASTPAFRPRPDSFPISSHWPSRHWIPPASSLPRRSRSAPSLLKATTIDIQSQNESRHSSISQLGKAVEQEKNTEASFLSSSDTNDVAPSTQADPDSTAAIVKTAGPVVADIRKLIAEALPFLQLQSNVFWIDVETVDSVNQDGAWVNPESLHVAMYMIRKLVNGGISLDQIVHIYPYALHGKLASEKCEELDDLLIADGYKSQTPSLERLLGITADRSKGIQRDVAIYDVVRTQQSKQLRDIDNIRLARTRGKYQLFIIGNSKSLFTRGRWRGNYLWKLYRSCVNKKATFTYLNQDIATLPPGYNPSPTNTPQPTEDSNESGFLRGSYSRSPNEFLNPHDYLEDEDATAGPEILMQRASEIRRKALGTDDTSSVPDDTRKAKLEAKVALQGDETAAPSLNTAEINRQAALLNSYSASFNSNTRLPDSSAKEQPESHQNEYNN